MISYLNAYSVMHIYVAASLCNTTVVHLWRMWSNKILPIRPPRLWSTRFTVFLPVNDNRRPRPNGLFITILINVNITTIKGTTLRDPHVRCLIYSLFYPPPQYWHVHNKVSIKGILNSLKFQTFFRPVCKVRAEWTCRGIRRLCSVLGHNDGEPFLHSNTSYCIRHGSG